MHAHRTHEVYQLACLGNHLDVRVFVLRCLYCRLPTELSGPVSGNKIQPNFVNAQNVYLSSCWAILLKKLILSQVIGKFAAFYGSRGFMTAYRKIRIWAVC
jgi:hypothetical protein